LSGGNIQSQALKRSIAKSIKMVKTGKALPLGPGVTFLAAASRSYLLQREKLSDPAGITRSAEIRLQK
jgi:hypothetical protein